MSRSAAAAAATSSPRIFQLYSPRRPSPLGLPPLAPHVVFQDAPEFSAYPMTPEIYYIQQSEVTTTTTGPPMRFPPEARRPGDTQRVRAPPPAPLRLDAQNHPAAGNGQTLQPPGTLDMRVPPSPTPSSASSLSLYSTDSTSAKKSLPMGVIQEEAEGEQGERRKSGGGGFCLCFSAFLFYLLFFLQRLHYFVRLFSTIRR